MTIKECVKEGHTIYMRVVVMSGWSVMQCLVDVFLFDVILRSLWGR